MLVLAHVSQRMLRVGMKVWSRFTPKIGMWELGRLFGLEEI
jgi:hypothetical protein